jgi:biopolymer transport protein ExbD
MTQSDEQAVEAILAAARRPDSMVRARSKLRRRSYYERAKRRRGGWAMSLNLTPMIDTVFNLLFFFMIASRFGAIVGLLPADMPAQAAAVAGAAPTSVPRMPLRVRLQPDAAHPERCDYRIDRLVDEPMPMKDLPARLAHILESEPGFGGDTPVYLLAPDSVSWNHVVNAYNAALSAHYEKVYFAGAP